MRNAELFRKIFKIPSAEIRTMGLAEYFDWAHEPAAGYIGSYKGEDVQFTRWIPISPTSMPPEQEEVIEFMKGGE